MPPVPLPPPLPPPPLPPPLPLISSSSSSFQQPPISSTIIANNLLVQASPPMSRSVTTERPPPTPVKPISHFQKLLHHFNGNRSSSNSSPFVRGTSLTSSQHRSLMKINGIPPTTTTTTTILQNHINRNHQIQTSEPKFDDSFPPPPPPEMAHEQLLDLLLQSNRTRISSISPSPSTSSATTHTSIQRIMMSKKKQTIMPMHPSSISPTMSNSDLSFSPSGINITSPSKSPCIHGSKTA